MATASWAKRLTPLKTTWVIWTDTPWLPILLIAAIQSRVVVLTWTHLSNRNRIKSVQVHFHHTRIVTSKAGRWYSPSQITDLARTKAKRRLPIPQRSTKTSLARWRMRSNSSKIKSWDLRERCSKVSKGSRTAKMAKNPNLLVKNLYRHIFHIICKRRIIFHKLLQLRRWLLQLYIIHWGVDNPTRKHRLKAILDCPRQPQYLNQLCNFQTTKLIRYR